MKIPFNKVQCIKRLSCSGSSFNCSTTDTKYNKTTAVKTDQKHQMGRVLKTREGFQMITSTFQHWLSCSTNVHKRVHMHTVPISSQSPTFKNKHGYINRQLCNRSGQFCCSTSI